MGMEADESTHTHTCEVHLAAAGHFPLPTSCGPRKSSSCSAYPLASTHHRSATERKPLVLCIQSQQISSLAQVPRAPPNSSTTLISLAYPCPCCVNTLVRPFRQDTLNLGLPQPSPASRRSLVPMPCHAMPCLSHLRPVARQIESTIPKSIIPSLSFPSLPPDTHTTSSPHITTKPNPPPPRPSTNFFPHPSNTARLHLQTFSFNTPLYLPTYLILRPLHDNILHS
ncbi:hypothetical protein BKA64DRAFT_29524 [Cadophora sp. MPI-SDFR-AT-0126]|nr:hypothetical protein BKA64DRAFT_29524 [Leotiomycetes sp. MPI-SDFR-AT-0126]